MYCQQCTWHGFWEDAKPAPWDVYSDDPPHFRVCPDCESDLVEITVFPDEAWPLIVKCGGPRGMVQALHDILVIIRETRDAPADVKKQALDQIGHILFDRHGVTKDEWAKYIPTDEEEATR